ncbi:type IV pilus modification protein PilV [Pseudomonas sp. ok602]|uniref:type IV pilus modification protein PilV n=1 Tax=unclassified Pseudomonas TaxID=196821 RepID=UPI000B888FD1|nr:type IV pilus modification protein PilV [Pseudomonas sp. ok602]
MTQARAHTQDGMTLIEVLVALVIFSVGLLGAAAVQLKALKYTDSALMSTQASFIAYAMLDRIRANSGADYALASPGAGGQAPVHHQDVHDFNQSVLGFGGPSATGHIRQDQGLYTLAITWDDSRAAGTAGGRRSLLLSSRAGVDSEAAR